MKKPVVGIAALAAAGLCSGPVSPQTGEEPFGTWRHPANGSHIQIYKCGEGLCGRIAKINDSQKTDEKNPDPAKRNRPIIGLVIMSGAKKTGPNTWAGSLYNRANGNTYSGTVTVKSRNVLDLSGCTFGVLCQTVTWTRIN